MIRTQIQLTESQAQALKVKAREQGVSMAELVRQAVDLLTADQGRKERKRRALAVVGKYGSGRGDIAREHDRYLDEAYAD